MAWFCSGSTNSELVENLYNSGLIKNDRVKKAMLGVSVPFIS
jgi:protein-L-isoaspartate(D-aspartate) O-methyltransferase